MWLFIPWPWSEVCCGADWKTRCRNFWTWTYLPYVFYVVLLWAVLINADCNVCFRIADLQCLYYTEWSVIDTHLSACYMSREGGDTQTAYVTLRRFFLSETCQKRLEQGNHTIVNMLIPASKVWALYGHKCYAEKHMAHSPWCVELVIFVKSFYLNSGRSSSSYTSLLMFSLAKCKQKLCETRGNCE